MATYSWPSKQAAQQIGKRHDKLDAEVKSNGEAKFTYDVNLPKQLVVRALGCPHAHCRVKSVDATATNQVPGVVYVHMMRAPKPGDDGQTVFPEIQFEGDLIGEEVARPDQIETEVRLNPEQFLQQGLGLVQAAEMAQGRDQDGIARPSKMGLRQRATSQLDGPIVLPHQQMGFGNPGQE